MARQKVCDVGQGGVCDVGQGGHRCWRPRTDFNQGVEQGAYHCWHQVPDNPPSVLSEAPSDALCWPLWGRSLRTGNYTLGIRPSDRGLGNV
jgi:hypothetical protein